MQRTASMEELNQQLLEIGRGEQTATLGEELTQEAPNQQPLQSSRHGIFRSARVVEIIMMAEYVPSSGSLAPRFPCDTAAPSSRLITSGTPQAQTASEGKEVRFDGKGAKARKFSFTAGPDPRFRSPVHKHIRRAV